MTKRTDKTDQQRRSDGTFGKGNPGRPRGSRNKTTLALEALLEGEAEALGRKAIELALEGDSAALRLCMERLLPARKGRPVRFELPDGADAASTLEALHQLLKAVSAGEISPDEAKPVGDLLEARRRALETEELEQRLSALEQSAGKK